MNFLKFSYKKLLIFIFIILLIIKLIYNLDFCSTAVCSNAKFNLSYYGLYLLAPWGRLDIHPNLLYKYFRATIYYKEEIEIFIGSIFIILNIAYLYLLSCSIDYLINKYIKRK
ncbi:hypothetical protein A2229_00225 [Candidatus Peregrinibacteria bacterium RIFOXYA2_FULL_33_7]|nr:MAG: hypothetical protein A2229_00225 [Candidatus Peregrinibacteria bacterium RIFOXYA2_FULL_33_7]